MIMYDSVTCRTLTQTQSGMTSCEPRESSRLGKTRRSQRKILWGWWSRRYRRKLQVTANVDACSGLHEICQRILTKMLCIRVLVEQGMFVHCYRVVDKFQSRWGLNESTEAMVLISICIARPKLHMGIRLWGRGWYRIPAPKNSSK